MKKCDFKKPYASEWRVLYRAAVFSKASDHAMEDRICEAEDAIIERMRELFRDTGAEAEGEREALNDAMYALRAWKIALENRTHVA